MSGARAGGDGLDRSTGPNVVLPFGTLDMGLRDRLAAALAAAPGVRLTDDPAGADAVIGPVPEGPAWEPDLTAREAEVLAILAERLQPDDRGPARHLGAHREIPRWRNPREARRRRPHRRRGAGRTARRAATLRSRRSGLPLRSVIQSHRAELHSECEGRQVGVEVASCPSITAAIDSVLD